MEEGQRVRSLWALKVTVAQKRGAGRREAFRKVVGDCYHNAVCWMRDNISEVEAVIEAHINDEPKVELEDVFTGEDR